MRRRGLTPLDPHAAKGACAHGATRTDTDPTAWNLAAGIPGRCCYRTLCGDWRPALFQSGKPDGALWLLRPEAPRAVLDRSGECPTGHGSGNHARARTGDPCELPYPLREWISTNRPHAS